MFERPDVGERAVLVHIDFTAHDDTEDPGEFRELVTSAGVEPVATVTGTRKQPSPRFFVGEGKLEEIRDAVDFIEAHSLRAFCRAMFNTNEFLFTF